MPEYRVYVQETYDVWYDIEADNAEEAWEAYYEGEAIESGREFLQTIEGTEEVVNRDDETVPKTDWVSLFGKDEEDIL